MSKTTRARHMSKTNAAGHTSGTSAARHASGTDTSRHVGRTGAARWAALTLALSIGTGLPAAGTAATAATGHLTSGRAAACGLYRDEDAAQYRNCSAAAEKIYVTYIWSSNQTYCVPPGAVKHLGRWNNVFRVYNQGGC
ncbi:hypothetical protein Skr01_71680 [Sphaerisporangium krabiense]|uniref:Uncharacterized protein n=1 Tax=Sphaerisporangium krabiense TaxID=763782 RepID=A0A7W8Z8A1_9ACTN|nr:DUF6355 family natural product biosynthesis protein [Sphaerisporangium krabiense]MBB5629309.1 hypothetical protein [Sphaerisporangium krabiense]GII67083.1 hypothetical protein Skr01_71680 [Sphaerisporangium krabiense]